MPDVIMWFAPDTGEFCFFIEGAEPPAEGQWFRVGAVEFGTVKIELSSLNKIRAAQEERKKLGS
jgi:hypothetical protein